MATKRMFTMKICDTDAFLDMPLSSQCLYFHLCMRADDDGFIGNPKRIKGMIGASDDDLKLLIAKRFLLVFEDGVIVIKHWKMHNTIQKDRYTPTPYQDELSQLFLKKNKSYSFSPTNNATGTKCIQNVSTDIDIDLVLDSGKEVIEEKPKRKRFVTPTLEEVREYCWERKNDVDAERFVNYYTANGWQVGKNKMKDWKAAVRTWEKNSYSQTQKGFVYDNTCGEEDSL